MTFRQYRFNMETTKRNTKGDNRMKYLLVDYSDVRKNEEGAWNILEFKNIGELEIKEGAADKELIDALKDYEYLNEKANTNTIEIWKDGDIIVFYDRKTGEPIGGIEPVD